MSILLACIIVVFIACSLFYGAASVAYFCDSCDLLNNCIIANDCENLIGLKRVFKKSDKKFEK